MKQCNCISKYIETFKKKYDLTDDYEVKHNFISMSFEDKINHVFTGTSSFRKNYKGKWTKIILVYNYCPLCGELCTIDT